MTTLETALLIGAGQLIQDAVAYQQAILSGNQFMIVTVSRRLAAATKALQNEQEALRWWAGAGEDDPSLGLTEGA